MSNQATPTLKNPTWEATKAAAKDTAIWTVGWAIAESAVRVLLFKAPAAATLKQMFSPSTLKWDIALFGACSAFFTAPKAYKAAVEANASIAKAEAGANALPHADPVMTRSFTEKLAQECSQEQGAAAEIAR